jgi:hypothetical protein
MLAHATHTLAAPNAVDEDWADADEEEDEDEEDEDDCSSAGEAASGSGGASRTMLTPTQLEQSVWPQIGQRTLYGPSMPNEELHRGFWMWKNGNEKCMLGHSHLFINHKQWAKQESFDACKQTVTLSSANISVTGCSATHSQSGHSVSDSFGRELSSVSRNAAPPRSSIAMRAHCAVRSQKQQKQQEKAIDNHETNVMRAPCGQKRSTQKPPRSPMRANAFH